MVIKKSECSQARSIICTLTASISLGIISLSAIIFDKNQQSLSVECNRQRDQDTLKLTFRALL